MLGPLQFDGIIIRMSVINWQKKRLHPLRRLGFLEGSRSSRERKEEEKVPWREEEIKKMGSLSRGMMMCHIGWDVSWRVGLSLTTWALMTQIDVILKFGHLIENFESSKTQTVIPEKLSDHLDNLPITLYENLFIPNEEINFTCILVIIFIIYTKHCIVTFEGK